jgi:YbbR domain-containing protein
MAKIFENLWVKIASVLLATLLWFHVATEKTYQMEISLPLAQIEVSDDLVIAEPPPDSIRVLVSASGKTLLRSAWKRSGLRLVVTGSRAAKFVTEVTPTNLSLIKGDKLKLMEVIQPREIVLTCERKMRKTVPIISELVVHPDEGYIISEKESIFPKEVTLTGPWGQLKDIDSIKTVPKTIEGVRDDFSSRIALQRPDIYGLVMQPDTVVAYFNVTPIKRREIKNIAVKLINVPSGRNYTVTPKTVDLRVAGKTEIIDSLSAELFSAIADYVAADKNGVTPLQIVTPTSIKILYQSADSAKITEDNADSRN